MFFIVIGSYAYIFNSRSRSFSGSTCYELFKKTLLNLQKFLIAVLIRLLVLILVDLNFVEASTKRLGKDPKR